MGSAQTKTPPSTPAGEEEEQLFIPPASLNSPMTIHNLFKPIPLKRETGHTPEVPHSHQFPPALPIATLNVDVKTLS